jgi:serine/threonine-protein kinase
VSSKAAVKPGDVVAGKYRIERLLGSGGMGYVVSARHLQLGQLVAMKFLRSEAVENADATKRFFREAKAIARLRSENIARIYDVDVLDSGEPYIVMEYLEGKDLAAIVTERTTLPPSEAADYVIQTCEALAEAHALGIVHRDIKLANLFVTRGPAGTPVVKLLDFGISKSFDVRTSRGVTKAASLLGSPRFMSPEQMCDARTVDARTDVWSLGVVLYRVVSGKAPFEADTLGRLLNMVMHEKEAALSTLVRDLPRGFERVVARCLEKDPEDRFADVGALADALVPFAADATRARGAAERVAAIFGVAREQNAIHEPRRSAISLPPSPRSTGTNAPWVGARAPSLRRVQVSSVGLFFVVAALLTLTGVLAKLRWDEAALRRPAVAASEPPPRAEPELPASAVPTASSTGTHQANR